MRIPCLVASIVVFCGSVPVAVRAQAIGKVATPAVQRHSLAQLLAESGYRYSAVNATTWRIVVKGAVVAEIAVYVSESTEAVAFAVKVANRSQLPVDPAVVNKLLTQNSQSTRARIAFGDHGDLLVSSSISTRLLDLVEFKSQIDEIARASDLVARDLNALVSNASTDGTTTSGANARSPRMTNADVLKLMDAGVSSQAIVLAINAAEPAFDRSTDALIALKKKGASDAIMQAVLTRAADTHDEQPPAPPVDVAAAEPDPSQLSYKVTKGNFVHRPGILRIGREVLEYRSDDKRDSFSAPLHVVQLDMFGNAVRLMWPGNREFVASNDEAISGREILDGLEQARVAIPLGPKEVRAALAQGQRHPGSIEGIEAERRSSAGEINLLHTRIVFYTPLRWIEQLASDAAKAGRILKEADIVDESRRANVIRVLALPDSEKPNASAPAVHLLIKDSKVEDELRPADERGIARGAAHGLLSEFDFASLSAMGLENSDFVVVASNARGGTVEFVAKRSLLDPPSLAVEK